MMPLQGFENALRLYETTRQREETNKPHKVFEVAFSL